MPDFRAEVERRLGELDTDPASRAEIIEELAQHLGDCYETALSRGLDPASAEAAALAELSGANLLGRGLNDSVRPAPAPTPPIGRAERRTWHSWLWLDVRHAVRSLLNSPGYSLLALLTLALGIGASTAIYSVVDAVMLRRLPFAQPEQLVRIWESNLERGWSQFALSEPNFLDFAARTRAFEHVAVTSARRLALTTEGRAEMLDARAVSHEFLSTLRVVPTLGRDLTAADDVPGGDTRVVLLMDGFWRSLGADPGIVGRTLLFDGAAHRVIGVLPEGFAWGDGVSVLMPLAPNPAGNRGDHRLSMIGRLAEGETLDAARLELESIAKQLGESYPDTNRGWSVTLNSFYDWLVPLESRQSLLVLAVAVGLLLLIACGNVANLMLARANARHRELAIRAAIGADRHRIVAYVLVEAVVLALAAGTLGLLVAFFGIGRLAALGPDAFPRLDELTMNPSVLAFALAVSVATGLLFGSLTGWRAARLDLNATLRDGSQGAGLEARRLRGVLVVAEVALSVALLIGAGLLVRSFLALQRVDPGFPTADLVAASINLPRQGYDDPVSHVRFYEQLLAQVRAQPGMRAAALSSMVPFSSGDTSTEVQVPGWDRPPDAGLPSASWRLVSPGYFAALGIPLHGRDFDSSDNVDRAPTAIISESMAQLYWPGQDALGKSVIFKSLGASPVTIVGVAGDVRTFGLDAEPGSMVYVSTFAVPGWNPMQLVVRSPLEPEALAGPLRETLRRIDTNVPLFGVDSLDNLLARSFAERRLNMYLLACFALAALVLASVGLGGTIIYLVSQRTREIGIRIALGAPTRLVFRLVLRDGMRLAIAGAAIGVLVALLLSRTMQSQLFAVSANDPLTFFAVPALLLLVAYASCWWPAQRASRVQPIRVLRND